MADTRPIRGRERVGTLIASQVNEGSAGRFIASEIRMAIAIASLLVCAGYVRVALFHAEPADAAAICASLFTISALAVVLGASLPLVLSRRHPVRPPSHAISHGDMTIAHRRDESAR